MNENKFEQINQENIEKMKQQPVLTVMLLRHAQAVEEEVDKKRPLSEEGGANIDTTGDYVASVLEKDADKYILNNLDAKNTRAHQTQERFTKKLNEHGVNTFMKPIKAGKGGLKGDEVMELSSEPRQHTTYPALAKQIMKAKMEPGNEKSETVMAYYKRMVQATGVEKPTSAQIINTWLTDENPPKFIESPISIKEFFMAAIKNQNEDIPKLASILPKGKTLLTVIGANNPRVDLLFEALSGHKMNQDNELVDYAQGMQIDFREGVSPTFKVIGPKIEETYPELIKPQEIKL